MLSGGYVEFECSSIKVRLQAQLVARDTCVVCELPCTVCQAVASWQDGLHVHRQIWPCISSLCSPCCWLRQLLLNLHTALKLQL